EINKTKMLFPGDAQIENWSYALSKAAVRRRLEKVNVYKVGHHGSRNATPKTLWNGFKTRSTRSGDKNRLKSFMSTMAGKHGKAASKTEVPRRTLVEALESESELHRTDKLKGKTLSYACQIEF